MKLIRNTTDDGTCKYALIRLDKIRAQNENKLKINEIFKNNPEWLRQFVEFGAGGSKDEFFVIKLQDVNAAPALRAYAKSAIDTDTELAREVLELAERAEKFIIKKTPD